MDPFAAWLALRGLRTLSVRVERQCATAARLAAMLATLPSVRAVHYPGLTSHPDHRTAATTLAAPGGDDHLPAGGRRGGPALLRPRAHLHARGQPGRGRLAGHPPGVVLARGLSPAERARLGIDEGLLRLSVGIEDAGDLEADLRQALGAQS